VYDWVRSAIWHQLRVNTTIGGTQETTVLMGAVAPWPWPPRKTANGSYSILYQRLLATLYTTTTYKSLEMIEIKLQIDDDGVRRVMKWSNLTVVFGQQVGMQPFLAVWRSCIIHWLSSYLRYSPDRKWYLGYQIFAWLLWWRHVTWKVKVVVQICLDANILKSVRDSIGQTPCSLNIFLLI